MGRFQERIGRITVHRVDIRIAVVKTAFALLHDREANRLLSDTEVGADGSVQIAAKFRDDTFAQANGIDFQQNRFLAKLRMLRNDTARESRGPAVFIIEPGLHADGFAIVGAGINQLEPFIAEVFRLQAGTTVHEKAAHAHILHDIDLAQELVLFQLTVPAPKRLPTPFDAWVFKFFNHCFSPVR